MHMNNVSAEQTIANHIFIYNNELQSQFFQMFNFFF